MALIPSNSWISGKSPGLRVIFSSRFIAMKYVSLPVTTVRVHISPPLWSREHFRGSETATKRSRGLAQQPRREQHQCGQQPGEQSLMSERYFRNEPPDGKDGGDPDSRADSCRLGKQPNR